LGLTRFPKRWLFSQTRAALADPTRCAILLRLAQGDATVGEWRRRLC